MTEEERRAWIRMLVVLAVAAAVRSAWTQRASASDRPGVERDVAAALDTIDALVEEDARRTRPLGTDERLDPNRADVLELDRLPGVGPATAQAIVAAREVEPFVDAADLLRVRGIGPATLARLEPHLRVAPPPGSVRRSRSEAPAGSFTVDVNRADSATLERLPGIGPALAGRIVADRTRNGSYRSVEELTRVGGIGPATVARLRAHAAAR